MSVRSHRIKEVIYDESSMNFSSGDALCEAIRSNGSDKTDMEGGGIIEIPFIALKDILENKGDYDFNEEQIEELTNEVNHLTELGTDDDTYITYDMF